MKVSQIADKQADYFPEVNLGEICIRETARIIFAHRPFFQLAIIYFDKMPALLIIIILHFEK